MENLTQITMFNNILDDFIEYLELNFKNYSSDLLLVKNYIYVMRTSNPRDVVNMFMKFSSLYRDQIFKCDDKFFLNTAPDNDNLLYLKIKSVWLSKNIEHIQKANIWVYLQKLTKIGEMVNL